MVVCFESDRVSPGAMDALRREEYRLTDLVYAIHRQRAQELIELRLRWEQDIKANFRLRREHVVLLKEMTFGLVEGTDVASVAASGKYPFGNSDWVKDVYAMLGWVAAYDENGLKDECVHRAQRIMAELPLALNAILAGLSPQDYPEHPALGDS